MWSSYGKSFTKLILLDGARRVEIKGVLPEVSTLGEGRLRTQENGAFREALDDETIPDKYCRWKLSKPDTRNEVNAIERPMAQIENVASDDQGNAHGDFTARFGQHSFMYRLKHVADAKQGDEV
jgi:hypothetical protein